MKKVQNPTQIICEIGIFAAIGYILDELQSVIFKGVFINGGSIGFAMIVIFIVGFRRGFIPALVTGLIMGLFDLATGAYIIHPAQLFLDYLTPYALVAVGILVSPLFKRANHKGKCWLLVLSVLIGGTAKFLSHYASGILFWANPENFAWGLTNFSPYLYCFIYNIAFIGPSIILTSILLVLVYLKAPKVFEVAQHDLPQSLNNNQISISEVVISGVTLLFGLSLFVTFLTFYILSYSSTKDASSFYYSFSNDSMVIFILGFFLLILGIYSLVNSIKKSFSYMAFSFAILLVLFISSIYSLTVLIKKAQSGNGYVPYIIWFLISVLLLLLFILLFIKFKKQNKN